MTAGAVRLVQAHANHGAAAVDGELKPVHFPRRIERPLPGDLVRIDNAGTLTEVLERRNLFGRGDNRGRFRPIAANLDRAVIVIAAEPAPSRDLLHRYLAACLIREIEPLIVVNKSDLPRPEQPPFTELDQLAELGFASIEARCQPDLDVASLEARIRSGVTLLAGQSGVGKSSLLNALIPDLEARTRQLSRVTGKGRHTTTTATAHPYADGGWLIDTPGVWEYGLWKMDARTLERGFPEFSEHAAACRFRDCRHRSEPGCGVIAAVESSALPAFRHEAWLRLLAEQERLGR
ncbi:MULTISPECIES: ribosome small subunit-dependent GTPase A [unclassified Wenzhouxiangella]|uniref:ribosome small subunit-dependent GTPase A n=1 Tax=unclassified Wenzhouxiangella TaxID=2613841 RepID=UPI000E32C4C2|nr:MULTISPECIES: ribosome small subunit-dependent GTPase A [unclassified Wenzhouxiangella]RFF28677.1 ribosome small subunit-dependent GTPase A [Wenzhouxiangella sp. 15181]RFP70266.1 ribosome small subunit-dependent GTPase A [Wenzhouxiangella sp. 15190]